jgi:hypothetical protein
VKARLKRRLSGQLGNMPEGRRLGFQEMSELLGLKVIQSSNF